MIVVKYKPNLKKVNLTCLFTFCCCVLGFQQEMLQGIATLHVMIEDLKTDVKRIRAVLQSGYILQIF